MNLSSLLLLAVSAASLQGIVAFVTPSRAVATAKPTTLNLAMTAPEKTIETKPESHPKIIQGGMGVRISSWKLAREVSRRGELGVISGTAMDVIFVRTLQDGDPGGHFRRALKAFPDQAMAKRALEKYFIDHGKSPTKPYRSLPLWTLSPPRQLEEVTILGNYCEVWLAKHDDDGNPTGGKVGINRLTKVALPTIHSLYGAMLADVDYVIMGAGIPNKIPGILDALAEGKDCALPIEVSGANNDDEAQVAFAMKFSPTKFWKETESPALAQEPLRRPDFLPIVSSTTLAQSLLKRSNGEGPTRGINGFVVELNSAGGHNAPPRGWRYEPTNPSMSEEERKQKGLNERGEPVYGEKDMVDVKDFGKVAKGLPYWFAGSYGRKEKLVQVLEGGGNGIQVGTLFALAEESGMDPIIKHAILSQLGSQNDLKVFTDPAASPTGFPFKVLQLDGNTLSNPSVYNSRPRACNLGYLRVPYVQEDGKVGYKCPSEPVQDYVSKGGDAKATIGRKCLCNALCADAGFPQVRNVTNAETGEKELYIEPGLVTIGDDVNQCKRLLKKHSDGTWGYSATDVLDYLLSEVDNRQQENTIQNLFNDILVQDQRSPGSMQVEDKEWNSSPNDGARYSLAEWEENHNDDTSQKRYHHNLIQDKNSYVTKSGTTKLSNLSQDASDYFHSKWEQHNQYETANQKHYHDVLVQDLNPHLSLQLSGEKWDSLASDVFRHSLSEWENRCKTEPYFELYHDALIQEHDKAFQDQFHDILVQNQNSYLLKQGDDNEWGYLPEDVTKYLLLDCKGTGQDPYHDILIHDKKPIVLKQNSVDGRRQRSIGHYFHSEWEKRRTGMPQQEQYNDILIQA